VSDVGQKSLNSVTSHLEGLLHFANVCLRATFPSVEAVHGAHVAEDLLGVGARLLEGVFAALVGAQAQLRCDVHSTHNDCRRWRRTAMHDSDHEGRALICDFMRIKRVIRGGQCLGLGLPGTHARATRVNGHE